MTQMLQSPNIWPVPVAVAPVTSCIPKLAVLANQIAEQ